MNVRKRNAPWEDEGRGMIGGDALGLRRDGDGFIAFADESGVLLLWIVTRPDLATVLSCLPVLINNSTYRILGIYSRLKRAKTISFPNWRTYFGMTRCKAWELKCDSRLIQAWLRSSTTAWQWAVFEILILRLWFSWMKREHAQQALSNWSKL